MRENHPDKIRELSPDEVRLKIQDLREELFNLRFRNSMRQLDNSLKIRETRRDLARLVTILSEHERGVRLLGAGKVKG
jgi:large subunit ribosomal protein L29